MSTILKALQRLEQDKARDIETPLRDEVVAPFAASDPPRGVRTLTAVLAAAALLMAGVALFVVLRDERTPPIERVASSTAANAWPQSAPANPGPVGRPEPVRAIRPAAPHPSAPAPEAQAQNAARRAQMAGTPVAARTSRALPNAAERPTRAAATAPTLSVAASGARLPETAPVESNRLAPVAAAPVPGADASRVATETTSIEETAASGSASSKTRGIAEEARPPTSLVRSDTSPGVDRTPKSPASAGGLLMGSEATRALAIEIAPRPIPEIHVAQTVWHPEPARRIAVVRIAEQTDLVKLREGDAVGALVVREIQPSGVVFSNGDVDIQRRVGR